MNLRTLATYVVLGSVALALCGCATVPPAPTTFLDGTRWAVVDVNGVNIQDRSDFTVSFSGTRFEGQFGCRHVSGNYTLRPAANDVEQAIYQGSDARVTGEPCVGNLPEEIGPELLGNASMSLQYNSDGYLIMLQPPTGMALRPL